MLARWRHSRWSRVVTNADKPEAESLLHRIAFWVYEQKDELFRTDAEIKADALRGHPTSRLPFDGVLCLIFQIISAEEFELRPCDGSPPISWPPNFLLQRANASALMADLLKMIRERGGELWQMWLSLVAEMNDRALYDDDVPSPMRRLIRRAQKLPSSTSSLTSVLDERFAPDRHCFYDSPSHRTGDSDSSDDEAVRKSRRNRGRKGKGKAPAITGGPSELPPWSFLSEGGFLIDPHIGLGKFPGVSRTNSWETYDVLSSKRGAQLQEEGAPAIHPELYQREQDFIEIRNMLKEVGDDWATRLDTGNLEDDGCWVGIFEETVEPGQGDLTDLRLSPVSEPGEAVDSE